tara:strand:+ start:1133 stop:2602 length:1470 start_codon:yes stop_codon:yes gene_type:complete
MKLTLWLLLSFFALWNPVYGFNIQQQYPLSLGVGEQRILSIENLKKFSIGSKIVRAIPLPEELSSHSKNTLSLKGITPGITSLWIWTTDGKGIQRTIEVFPWKKQKKYDRTINFLIDQLPHINVIPTTKGYLLKGTLHNWEEAEVASLLKNQYPKKIQSDLQWSETLKEKILSRLNTQIVNSHFRRNIQINTTPHDLVIFTQSPENPLEKTGFNQWVSEIKKSFPMIKIISKNFSDGPNIFFKVYILEVDRSTLSSVGIDWPTGGAELLKVDPAGLSFQFEFLGKINLLKNKGILQVLSQPEISIRTPGKASLFSGGELPIKLQSRFATQVNWKKYGLQLEIDATTSSLQQVRFKIDAKMSELDYQIGPEDIPGIRSNHLKTEVEAFYGRPILLCGLLHERVKENKKGISFFSQIPVFGKLFGSTHYQNDESELIVALIPHLTSLKNLNHRNSFFDFPKGTIPPPRNWMTPKKIQQLKESKDYPWNALK